MNIFTYGSLMFPSVWGRVVRGDYSSAEARIHGFRRVRVLGAEHPALIISANAPGITGRVYFDVSAEDVARLDHFETANYVRVAIAATVADQAVVAQSYLALTLDLLSNEPWNVEDFERHGLPIFSATYVVANAPHD